MKTLLLEIGTEEIPAGYIEPALKALSFSLLKKLDENRLTYSSANTYGTPRRLAIKVRNLSARQKSITSEIIGPPEKIGFDENKNLLTPAIKFAEKAGISPEKLRIKNTDKGRYIYATVTQPGLSSKTILKEILPRIILSIPFPKTMRWGNLSISFARPIQWILAILDKEAISFKLGNLTSQRRSFGHRFMHPGKIKVRMADEYEKLLNIAFVMPEKEARRKYIENEIKKAADLTKAKALPDEELIDIVTYLVEYPVVAVGKFNEKFLKLPKEILITAMREHQKYFALTDSDDKLIPNFIVVNNIFANNMDLIVKGHERVLRARLEDAMFFYKNDAAVPLESNIEKLKGVLFQARLGSMYDKTLRVEKLSGFIAERIYFKNLSVEKTCTEFKTSASRAAMLCKADLVSQVVIEFPKLQGVMGRIYASISKESDEVPSAIEEHYMPAYSGGPLPVTLTGSVLSIADKMDSICGCFSVGLTPSGTSDPYALRRQGIGIIQIMLEKGFGLSLTELIKTSLGLYLSENDVRLEEILNSIKAFLKDRIANLLSEAGYSKDVIAAVVSVSTDCVPDIWKKAQALEQLKTAPDFEAITIAFKRVVHIINKSDFRKNEEKSLQVDVNLFEKDCESNLYSAFKEAKFHVDEKLKSGLFEQALIDISLLKGPVDDFFDGVLVMAEDENLRNNRLALLGNISSLFENIADFSKLTA